MRSRRMSEWNPELLITDTKEAMEKVERYGDNLSDFRNKISTTLIP